jgi:hypothetical protein
VAKPHPALKCHRLAVDSEVIWSGAVQSKKVKPNRIAATARYTGG